MAKVFTTFNQDHHKKVLEARKEKNLPIIDYDTHYDGIEKLEGKYLLDSINGKYYVIQDIRKKWYLGWYLSLIIQFGETKKTIPWDNISCSDFTTQETIFTNQKRYKLAYK